MEYIFLFIIFNYCILSKHFKLKFRQIFMDHPKYFPDISLTERCLSKPLRFTTTTSASRGPYRKLNTHYKRSTPLVRTKSITDKVKTINTVQDQFLGVKTLSINMDEPLITSSTNLNLKGVSRFQKLDHLWLFDKYVLRTYKLVVLDENNNSSHQPLCIK